MIAKIGHGSRIYGALVYNHSKVLDNRAEILHLHNMLETPDGKYSAAQLFSSFLPHLAANRKTEKTAVHISLNPDPGDKVTDEEFIRIADEYMLKMGYGNQPYVVFKHNDIERTHIHVVSTSVDKNGVKIPDAFEKKRSMQACREIEKKFNLIPANEKLELHENLGFSPVDYTKGNIKGQIAAVVRYLPKYYNYYSLGGYNALLSLFNISVEHIKKDYQGEMKEGLLYFALDKNGNKVSNPFKGSLFGKQAGLDAVKTNCKTNRNVPAEIKEKTAQVITEAIRITANEKQFRDYLTEHGINTVIRRNEENRLYGITFIDHNTRHVYNGSHLGKQFSANQFHELFSNGKRQEMVKAEQGNFLNIKKEKTSTVADELHPLFSFMLDSANLSSDWGLLNSLLLENIAEDPEEQIFEFNMKKKKKRKGQHKK
ncbi:relaxase [Chryseobacterium gallinarum]|uniref:Relaxase n=1 Tax=Chryseobacterium gallinarum TaxID=1324352 RepID=A0A0G3LWK0_CHRGL|nr:conjugal transfer protein MobB [Chryseobacterium gallinarum]AKK71341.1 relaxase [Chryseobacterium gallinarum]